MTALVFSDDLLWNWAAEVARITHREHVAGAKTFIAHVWLERAA